MVVGSASSGLSALYRQQSTDYSKILQQIASGKRFSKPSDDFVAYSRMSQQQADIRGIQSQNDNLVMAKGNTTEALGVANEVYKGVKELQGLEKQIAEVGASTDEGVQLKAQQDALLASLNETLTNSADIFTKADGVSVTVGAGSMTSQTALATAGATIAINTLDDAVEAFEDYMAEGNSFVSGVNRQLNINENLIAAKTDTADAIGAIDEMRAMTEMTNIAVRQQATVAMATQANLSQATMARLFQ